MPLRRTRVVAAERTQEKRTQHGKPRRVIRDDQPDAREGQAGRAGVAERLVVPRKPGNAGGGKGPQFKTNATSGEGPGIGKPSNSETCSRAAEGVARESEGRSRLSLLRAVRQDKPRRYSGARLCPVPLEQGCAGGWTGRTLRTSKRMGSSDGWPNWRLRSGRRHTDRSRSDACSYRRPMANSDRWASRPCGRGSAG